MPRQGAGDGPAWRLNVSRAADPAFNAAVIGNSRAQMLEPAVLDAGTGLRFVNLSIPGLTPVEKRLLALTFLRAHPEPRALVLGLDEWWCRPRQQGSAQFPAWLYADNAWDYAAGLMRMQTLEMLSRRIDYLMGRVAPMRADGYDDYTSHYAALTGAERVQQRMRTAARPQASDNPDHAFPAVAILQQTLQAVPAETPVVLMWPPRHVSAQPAPGSAAERSYAACRAALDGAATSRPRVAVVDWGGDNSINREPRHFHDETHYVKAVADQLGGAVASAVAGLLKPAP